MPGCDRMEERVQEDCKGSESPGAKEVGESLPGELVTRRTCVE